MAIELADKLYTSTQTADIIGVSLRTLYRYMEDGKIKSMRTASGRHRFTKDHIIEFLNAGQEESAEPVATSTYGGSETRPSTSSFGGQAQTQAQTNAPQSIGGTDTGQYAPADSSFAGQSAPQNTTTQPESQVSQFADDFTQQSDNSDQGAFDTTQSEVATDTDSYDDDFEFDITQYDYDSDQSDSDDVADTTYDESQTAQSNLQGGGPFSSPDTTQGQQQQQQPEVQQETESQYAQAQPSEQPYTSSPFSPPASTASTAQTEAPVQEEQVEQAPASETAEDSSTGLNIRYYKSDYTDLIELAKKIKDAATSKDLEYAFTVFAGLSLHFLIKPFTVLHIYANPEDMQLWKDELRLVPVQDSSEANVGIIINTDIVFTPTKDIGGFKVVEDKILLKDLSAMGEETLVKEFRQHLTSA